MENDSINISANGDGSAAAGRDINYYVQPSEFVILIKQIAKNAKQCPTILRPPPDIEKKIIFNNLKQKEKTIKSYAINYYSIEQAKEILEESENKGSFELVIDAINHVYIELEEKNMNYSAVILWEDIRQKIMDDNKINDSLFKDALTLLMVYAFIKCKIFEEPK